MTVTGASRRIAILAYHRIGARPGAAPSAYEVSVGRFEQQLEDLAAADWRVIDAETFVRALDDPSDLPARAALITFDDAYHDSMEAAADVLARRGEAAVCFVPTGHVGGTNVWDEGVEPRAAVCDWDALARLAARGISIQSHGESHRWMSLQDEATLRGEALRSREAIEARLGTSVRMLAYPYSDAGADRARTAAVLREAGYRAAFLCGGGGASNPMPPPDPFLIDRIAMYEVTELAAEFAADEASPP
jgi:peptidoglycan/xylan/chitin deacetylase (PgdA/CDA1 family)